MPPKRTNGPLVWMIVSQSLVLVSFVPWLALAGLSFMAFDSGVTWQASVFVIAVCSYPVVQIALAIIAWVCYARQRMTAAMVLTSVLLLPGLVMAVLLLVPTVMMAPSLLHGGLPLGKP